MGVRTSSLNAINNLARNGLVYRLESVLDRLGGALGNDWGLRESSNLYARSGTERVAEDGSRHDCFVVVNSRKVWNVICRSVNG
jgi:hypothetical protein